MPGGGGAALSARQPLSALDIAFWDIEGSGSGVLVYRLLGGPFGSVYRVYASHWLGGVKTPEEAYEGAREAVRRGFQGFKWIPLRAPDLRENERRDSQGGRTDGGRPGRRRAGR
ncbi:MAG: hypothetical protein R2849_08585 [Thermomicrobiales bacterium]